MAAKKRKKRRKGRLLDLKNKLLHLHRNHKAHLTTHKKMFLGIDKEIADIRKAEHKEHGRSIGRKK